MKAFIIMVFNSLMLVIIKSLVRLLVSQITQHLGAVMSVFKLICPTLVGLEINKKYLSLLNKFSVDMDV